jgi:hypothetical protein
MHIDGKCSANRIIGKVPNKRFTETGRAGDSSQCKALSWIMTLLLVTLRIGPNPLCGTRNAFRSKDRRWLGNTKATPVHA